MRSFDAFTAIMMALLSLGLGLSPAGAQSVEQVAESSEGGSAEVSSAPSWALADDAASAHPFIPEATTFSASGMLTRVGLGLVLVLGILGGVLFLYKKATRGTLGLNTRNSIELLTQRSLGQRSSLAVVRVGAETMLLGITAHQINLLTPLGSRAVLEEAGQTAPTTPNSAAVPSPAALLSTRSIPDVARAPRGVGDSRRADRVEETPFDITLAGEVRRVRENLVTSLRRLDLDR